MIKKIVSNQAIVKVSKNFTYKKFFIKKDYIQEKYFLEEVSKIDSEIVPKILNCDDKEFILKLETLENLLEENISLETLKKEFLEKIANKMSAVWFSPNFKIPKKYTYTNKKLKNYLYIFLTKNIHKVINSDNSLLNLSSSEKKIFLKIYNARLLASLNISKNTKKGIIHFDLSPRNIFYKNKKVRIIDWSRSMYSYVYIDLAILLAKFEVNINHTTQNFKGVVLTSGASLKATQDLAESFNIYRFLKRTTLKNSAHHKQHLLDFCRQ